MSVAAVALMVLVAGFVWGGFALLLVRAVRCESNKSGSGEGASGGS